MKTVLVTFVSFAVFSGLAYRHSFAFSTPPHAMYSIGVSSQTQPPIGRLIFEKQDSNKAELDPSGVKRKADALIAFLEKTKDKRVEKVVLRKYNWAGAAKEEGLNYNIKMGEAKYTVVRPGRDIPDAKYIVFIVRLMKSGAAFLVADDDQDGSVDRGVIQDKKASSEANREFSGKKGLGSQHREFWQGEYVKTVDALCQYLNASCEH